MFLLKLSCSWSVRKRHYVCKLKSFKSQLMYSFFSNSASTFLQNAAFCEVKHTSAV